MTTQSATPLPPVIIYSGPLCSGCAEVEAYLAAQGIPYEERNIRGAIETMIEFRRKGYEILPVIEVGSHVVSEYESISQVEDALRAEGYLAAAQ